MTFFLARWPAGPLARWPAGPPAEAAAGEADCGGPEPVPGWLAAFFRFGNSAGRFEKVGSYVRMRLALLISKRLHRSRAFGWPVVTFQSPDQRGLITRSGIVVDPSPFRDWRGRPNAGGKRRR